MTASKSKGRTDCSFAGELRLQYSNAACLEAGWENEIKEGKGSVTSRVTTASPALNIDLWLSSLSHSFPPFQGREVKE